MDGWEVDVTERGSYASGGLGAPSGPGSGAGGFPFSSSTAPRYPGSSTPACFARSWSGGREPIRLRRKAAVRPGAVPPAAAAVPHRDLVDLQVLDRLHLLGHDLRGASRRGGGSGASCTWSPQHLEQLLVALGLGLQHGLDALGLRPVAGEDRVRVAAGDPAPLLRLGLGVDLDLLALDHLLDDLLLLQAGLLLLALGEEHVPAGVGQRHLAAPLGVGAPLGEGGLVVGDRGLGLVLALDRLGLQRGHLDALLHLGLLLALGLARLLLGDAHLLVAPGVRLPGDPLGLELRDRHPLVALRLLLPGTACGELLGDLDLPLAVGARPRRSRRSWSPRPPRPSPCSPPPRRPSSRWRRCTPTRR